MRPASAPLKPSRLKITDPFWGRYMELVRNEVIPYQWEALNDRIPGAEPSYAMKNFRIAAGMEQGEHGGHVFQDSDAAKWIEAAAYTLAARPDPELEKLLDGAIDIICAAQREDGYLNTYYTITGLDKRWTNLKDNHELYCLGHFIEGAVAYYEARGKDKLLKTMIRYVDLVDRTFGREPGKLRGYPGHEVIEMALVRLYDVTQDEKHLQLARYFIDERGQSPNYFEGECADRGADPKGWFYRGLAYHQAALPVREQVHAEGHAVRAVYLYSGMADTARKTGDGELLEACRRLWRSITRRRMYITGAIGSIAHGEAFSYDYDLPNASVYGETCAAIGLVFFARRMLENEADSRYADVMERALYNGILSGMALDGKSFFYVNPLEVVPEDTENNFYQRHVKPVRQKWFGCACCPPNLARLLASLASYAYGSGEEGTLFVHLYVGGEIEHSVAGHPVKVQVDTAYPWKGTVNIGFSLDSGRPETFTCAFRVPGWNTGYSLRVNGEPIEAKLEGGYLYLRRDWKSGDTVSLCFDMPVRLEMANPAVREDAGKVAVCRGPLVYCLEEQDNGPRLDLLSLGEDPHFEVQYNKNLLEGVTVITGEGRAAGWPWGDELYGLAVKPEYRPKKLTWIPYYSWANRGSGEMRVWIRRI